MHGIETRVGGQQNDFATFASECFDRGLVAGDPRHDDVAVVGRLLLTGDDVVAIENAGLDHRVAADAQHEQITFAREIGGEGQEFFDIFLGQNIGTGGHVADEGYMVDSTARDNGPAIAIPVDFDGPGQVGVPFEEAEALQRAEVIVHGRRGGEPHGFADFSDRRGETTVFHTGFDALEDAALTVGEGVFAHGCIVRVFGL